MIGGEQLINRRNLSGERAREIEISRCDSKMLSGKKTSSDRGSKKHRSGLNLSADSRNTVDI